MSRVPERVVRRIAERAVVDPETGCWVWPGARRAGGYGHIGWQSKNVRSYQSTHRAMYEACVGPVPGGLDLDHLCRNRACCNPEHLEPVTRRENLLRGVTITAERAARTHCPQGHPYDEGNTYRDRRNRRSCRECGRIHSRAYWRARRAAARTGASPS